MNPDTGPPTAPSNLAAIGSLSSVALAWSDSSDDVGVVRYNVHRSTTQGFTPSAANRVGQPTGDRVTRTARSRPAPTTTGSPRRTRAGNISAASSEASAVVTGDTSRADGALGTLSATGSLSSVALTWGARPTTWASSATTSTARPRRASRRALRTGSRSRPARRYTDTGLAAGTYYYRVTAEDAAGNLSAASNQATATVTGDTTAPTAPAQPHGHAGLGHRHARLDGLDRQRRRRPLQRPPLDGERLHAERREPDRAADRHLVRRLRPRRRAPTTTASPPRTPPGT